MMVIFWMFEKLLDSTRMAVKGYMNNQLRNEAQENKVYVQKRRKNKMSAYIELISCFTQRGNLTVS